MRVKLRWRKGFEAKGIFQCKTKLFEKGVKREGFLKEVLTELSSETKVGVKQVKSEADFNQVGGWARACA